MPAFALRFVGQEALPPRLSEFDREQFFTLTSADVAALREQFRSDHRLPAALMLMFMRVAGRPLDGFNVLPRNLLRHTAQVLAVPPLSIASLRSICRRRQTLSKHQLWAKTYLGLRELEVDDEAALTAALLAQAADASHAELRTEGIRVRTCAGPEANDRSTAACSSSWLAGTDPSATSAVPELVARSGRSYPDRGARRCPRNSGHTQVGGTRGD